MEDTAHEVKRVDSDRNASEPFRISFPTPLAQQGRTTMDKRSSHKRREMRRRSFRWFVQMCEVMF